LDSSILNILPVSVVEIEDTNAARLLVRLSLGSQYLLARITRKSCVELGLCIGDNIYAQIKSAALLMETTDPA
jgi:molybdate transport system ATP-binding protein